MVGAAAAAVILFVLLRPSGDSEQTTTAAATTTASAPTTTPAASVDIDPVRMANRSAAWQATVARREGRARPLRRRRRVHLHGYDLHQDVDAGGTARIAFTAKIAGRFGPSSGGRSSSCRRSSLEARPRGGAHRRARVSRRRRSARNRRRQGPAGADLALLLRSRDRARRLLRRAGRVVVAADPRPRGARTPAVRACPAPPARGRARARAACGLCPPLPRRLGFRRVRHNARVREPRPVRLRRLLVGDAAPAFCLGTSGACSVRGARSRARGRCARPSRRGQPYPTGSATTRRAAVRVHAWSSPSADPSRRVRSR